MTSKRENASLLTASLDSFNDASNNGDSSIQIAAPSISTIRVNPTFAKRNVALSYISKRGVIPSISIGEGEEHAPAEAPDSVIQNEWNNHPSTAFPETSMGYEATLKDFSSLASLHSFDDSSSLHRKRRPHTDRGTYPSDSHASSRGDDSLLPFKKRPHTDRGSYPNDSHTSFAEVAASPYASVSSRKEASSNKKEKDASQSIPTSASKNRIRPSNDQTNLSSYSTKRYDRSSVSGKSFERHVPTSRTRGRPQEVKKEFSKDLEEMKVDAATDNLIDRMWYDRDEAGDAAMDDYYEEDEAHVSKREEKLKEQQARLPKCGLGGVQKRVDNDLWELNRLKQSGIGERREVNLVFETEEAVRDHVIVREVLPPFLDGRIVYTKQTEMISVVRDETSDMAKLAKKGSAVVHYLKDQEDRSALRQRFWELGGSTMGNVLGVKGSKQTEGNVAMGEEGEDHLDYKQDLQYGEIMRNQQNVAASDFTMKMTLEEQRRSLPVYECKEEFLEILREHPVVIVVGETGSGKTTQLTQYLYESGYGDMGVIGCTQPRRVAAVSVAKRVSDEMGVVLGTLVGYAIRFEDCTSSDTLIKYMTDGVLLRESLTDPELDRYSTIVMDEAHERSLNTDVLFGVLKKIVSQRHDFRLIVTSATMDTSKFAQFWGNAPIFRIGGRTFPVRIEYLRSPCEDYVDASVQKCLQIHCSESEGDILIFMTGQDDIEATCTLIVNRLVQLGDRAPPICVLPIYSQLPADMQAKIFERSDKRKVIVATNIAETSLTVDGVRYVIDCGYSKLKVYNAKVGMDSLQITPISQANSNQRSGRAGRTGPGVCYRLYTERAFVSELLLVSIPEIQRTNLANVVLLLKSLGIKNLLEFDFMDPPPQDTILNSMHQLWVLGALDNLGELTPLGTLMAQFPLDPPLSKMLLLSVELQSSAEMLTLVSMLSVPSIFYQPKEKMEELEAAREKFFVPESDHLTLINVYQQWKRHAYSASWCTSHCLQPKSLKKAREVRSQLVDIMEQQKLKLISCGTDWDILRKTICGGYFHNAAKLRGIGEYVNLRSSIPCHLHPSSALYGAGYTPDYVVYHEVVMTTKEYMRNVTAVEARWLAELGPMFFSLKQSGISSMSQRNMDREEIKKQEENFRAKLLMDAKEKRLLEAERVQRLSQIAHVVHPGVRRKANKNR